MDELSRLRVAVELHRPELRDKYAHITTDPAAVKHRRCTECHLNVPLRGCKTWRTAYPDYSEVEQGR